MFDIYIGIALMLLLSGGLFALGMRLARSMRRPALNILVVVVAAFASIHFLFLRDSILMTRLLPFSNVVVLGNWLPLMAGLLGGIAWRRMPGGILRRFAYLAPLFVLTLWAAYGQLLGKPPRCRDVWDKGVCIKTTRVSCSGAAAATLLKMHGIDANENEMSRLCLTRKEGTSTHGLFRGLKKKTTGTEWDVEAFHCSLDELRDIVKEGPALLSVWLEVGADVDPRYIDPWGWTPGLPHSVVLVQFTEDDRIEMADPAVGREEWSMESMHVLWHGDGMRLLKR